MIKSIHSICLASSLPTLLATFTPLQQTTSKIFEKMKDAGHPKTNTLQCINFHPLFDPRNFIEAGVWAGFWGLSLLFSALSLHDLYKVLTIEHPAAEKFSKITKAVKTAFVDLVYLGGSTVYNIHWGHEVKILSLGKYAPLIKGLGFGATLIVSAVEGGWSINDICAEKKALLTATSSKEQEKHKQQILISQLKVIGNINMFVWAALGIATITSGIAVSSILMSSLLLAGCVFPISAYFYQKNIEKVPKPHLLPA